MRMNYDNRQWCLLLTRDDTTCEAWNGGDYADIIGGEVVITGFSTIVICTVPAQQTYHQLVLLRLWINQFSQVKRGRRMPARLSPLATSDVTHGSHGTV